jgi:hypothetical protein
MGVGNAELAVEPSAMRFSGLRSRDDPLGFLDETYRLVGRCFGFLDHHRQRLILGLRLRLQQSVERHGEVRSDFAGLPVQDRFFKACLLGIRNASNGVLCDEQQLKQLPKYSGPTRLGGWTPTP